MIAVKGVYNGEAVEVVISGSSISEVRKIEDKQNLPYLSAGFVDLQNNGYKGYDFNKGPLSEQQWEEVLYELAKEGVTTVFPTIITNDIQVIGEIFASNMAVLERRPDLLQHIGGFHLEGPYISPEDGARGAHAKQYVKAPDWEEFADLQRKAKGMIKIVTLSPEWEGSGQFIEQASRSGVIVSIGHTSATSEQIEKAVQAGASMSTHLGNGAHVMMKRHPNYIWDQLAEERLTAGVISDGHHLPKNVLKVFCKTKGKNLFLVSDSVALAGMPAGDYTAAVGGTVTLASSGRLHLKENENILAGSAQNLRQCIEFFAGQEIGSLDEAIERSSVLPASIINIPVKQGIAPGAPADLVLFEWDQENCQLHVQKVFKNGGKLVEEG